MATRESVQSIKSRAYDEQLIRKDYCHQTNRVCAGHWCYCPLSNQSFFSLILPPSLSPLVTLLPHPGSSDGWYHHGDGSGSAWTTLLPAGRLREVQGSGRCQGVLRLRSARRADLVGTKGKFKKHTTKELGVTLVAYIIIYFCALLAFIIVEWIITQPAVCGWNV